MNNPWPLANAIHGANSSVEGPLRRDGDGEHTPLSVANNTAWTSTVRGRCTSSADTFQDLIGSTVEGGDLRGYTVSLDIV